MMAENPNSWCFNINGLIRTRSTDHQQPSSTSNYLSTPQPSFLLPPPQYVVSGSSNNSSDHHNQDYPLTWSQLLMGELASDQEERFCANSFQYKEMEEQIQNNNNNASSKVPVVDVKQEMDQSRQHILYSSNTTTHGDDHNKLQAHKRSWCSPVLMPVLISPPSPRSCESSYLSSNILDFLTNHGQELAQINKNSDHPSDSECNGSTDTNGASKKARVQPSTMQPPLKVGKEKLGERIKTLHQLVSPFGKTDTASVLLEVIGYIRFLEARIEALSSPYMDNGSAGSMRIQQSGNINEDSAKKNLRSRGLCLVPLSYADHLIDTGSDYGVEYWTSSATLPLGGGF